MTPLRQRMIVEMIRRGLARRTQESYLWGVISLANHYNRSPDRISERDIEDFLLSMSRRHLAPASVRLAWNGIAFFYRHVLGRLSKGFHPVMPRQRQRQPEILSPREVDAIIQQARRLRNRLLIILAYSGGLRVDEVRRLKWTDIDRDRRTIRIDQGKGQKDRYTVLGQRAIVVLDQYRSGVESEPWIFPGAKPGRYLSQSCVQRAYNDAKAAAGITKRGSIHALRHAFATHLVEQGTPLPLVQQLMGHRSVQTTMRYVHLAQCDPKLARSPLDGRG